MKAEEIKQIAKKYWTDYFNESDEPIDALVLAERIVKDYESQLKEERESQCFKVGHDFYVFTTKDNGRSVFGHGKCLRCGLEENFQYDY